MSNKTNTNTHVRSMVLCPLFAALTAVCSQIAIPMPWGVPISMALFSVYLAGALLGPVYGTISQLVYVALATVGMPVMAGFAGGPTALFSKTGGYVIGYMAAAFLIGLLVKRLGPSFVKLVSAMVLGCLACYAVGTVWFMAMTGAGLVQSLVWCVLPYLPGDALKIALAAIIVPRLKKQMPKI